MNRPDLLEKGIKAFNSGQFFQCHEDLEALWNTQEEPERLFTQGILQIAVAYHHLVGGNASGAKKLFQKGLLKLAHFADKHQGINVKMLTEQVEHSLSCLEQKSMPALEPNIQYIEPS